MRVSAYRKKTVGAALAAVLLVGGATACENGKKEDSGKPAAGSSAQPSKPAAGGSATEALAAAYKKTSAAKSAKVRMTMSMPAAAGAGGTMEMTGTQGWDPQVMDITMKGGGLTAGAGAESMRMIMSNNVMYMEVPKDSPMSEGLDGKRWMKLDITAAAEASGDAEAMKKLSGMGSMDQNQDPAKQLALLLSSPNVKHLGAEKVEGVDAEHYKGTVSFEEMLAVNEGAKVLSEAERTKLVEATKKAGIKGYDMDVWLNKDGYPVHMKVGIGTPQGDLNMDAYYSDYGSAATVQTPPENETLDLFAMLKELGQLGAGA
ncbi:MULTISPECIES: hypothetical protein [unclassified Streptomyces]|uniref:hypothetical protein n=1 Tax=unclassified Streptomyces TaxID=2593676 RepID=UPI0004BEFA3C|nr:MULTISPECIES: hypothetical protein [unclassified Streptomyces]KOU25300.1 lipoprotein [Streptomyces sp. WM6368]